MLAPTEKSGEREREKKAQVLLTIKAQIPHFMSALWFVYISRPWLIPLSFQPCLNPKPVTHLSQLQFRLSGKRKYQAGEVSHFSPLQLLLRLEPFNSAYTARRKATQITRGSIGCRMLALVSIRADLKERHEHPTILPLFSPSTPIRQTFVPVLTLFSRHSSPLPPLFPRCALLSPTLYLFSSV